MFGEGGGQGNVVGGFARSVTDAVREAQKRPDGEDWQTALSQRLRNAILDAVLNATISEALVQGTLGPIMDSLVEAIGAGNWQAVSVLSSMLAQGAQSLVEILSQSLSPLAGQFAVLHQAAEKAAQGLEASFFLRHQPPQLVQAGPRPIPGGGPGDGGGGGQRGGRGRPRQ